jgi:VanZ family protein
MFTSMQYLIWFLSVVLVVTGSLLPARSPIIHAVGMLPVSEKVLHFCIYTWLALLSLIIVRRRPLALLAAFAMALLGVTLEFGQKLVPGRAFEPRDMCINSLGVLTGVMLGILASRIYPVRTY